MGFYESIDFIRGYNAYRFLSPIPIGRIYSHSYRRGYALGRRDYLKNFDSSKAAEDMQLPFQYTLEGFKCGN